MRRAVHPGRLNQVLPAEQDAGALRSADELAAAVGDERGAALQVNVRNREDLRRGIDQHRNVVLLRDRRDRLGAHRPGLVALAGEDVNHRGPRADRELELFRRLDLDDLHAHGADGRVVDVARVPRDDDLILLEALEIRDADVEIGIAAGHAGGRRVRHRRRAAGADHAPLGAGELREALADGGDDLVELRVLLVGERLRRPDLGQLDVAAEHGQRAAAVDERPYADGLVDVLAANGRFRGTHRGWRRGLRRGRRRVRQECTAADKTCPPQQLTTAGIQRRALGLALS